MCGAERVEATRGFGTTAGREHALAPLQVAASELEAKTPAGAGDQDAQGGWTTAGRRRPAAAHGRRRAGACPWVGIVSAVGEALITRPIDPWVGMRSSDAVAGDALGAGVAAVAGAGARFTAGGGETGAGGGAGAAGGGAGFATTSGFASGGGAGFTTGGG